jgi:hypothetical protein
MRMLYPLADMIAADPSSYAQSDQRLQFALPLVVGRRFTCLVLLFTFANAVRHPRLIFDRTRQSSRGLKTKRCCDCLAWKFYARLFFERR